MNAHSAHDQADSEADSTSIAERVAEVLRTMPPNKQREIWRFVQEYESGLAGEQDKAPDPASGDIQPDQLLTTAEAAELLGIRSMTTLKLLVRREGLAYERHGNHMMIPLRELERLQGSAIVRGIQESDRAHDATVDLDGALNEDELEALEAARPGTLPWERA
ncbi:MAG: helix-turn-helix domain-containing protein [Chloroflexota bacterium]|jgi:excisionase family DNA binding protein|nr:helix-turn-helix domain-containing protein [Chloroflexota bacterium]